MALLSPTSIREIIGVQGDQDIDQLIGLESPTACDYADTESYSDGFTGATALFTGYQDFLSIHDDLIKRNLTSIGDLGAGNCRSKILFDFLKAPFQTFAYEFVPERVTAAINCYQKLSLSDVDTIIQADLKTHELPLLDAYFIYLPVGKTLKKIIQQLKVLSTQKPLTLYVIESHGDLLNYLEDQLCALERVGELPLKGVRHYPNIVIYHLFDSSEQIKNERTLLVKSIEALKDHQGFSLKNLRPWQKFYLFDTYMESFSLQFLISEEDKSWLASIEDWQYGVQRGTIETKHPFRIHNLDQINAIVEPPKSWLTYVDERRDTFQPPLSTIRKILISPEAAIERANGALEPVSELWPELEFPELF
ncbi:MAG: hypothetical protein K9K67_06305 [Bacteriovoracaceae bacterium]|nr:hypothetical protein [Bacteriovoracaceae bacterium]